MIQVFIALCSWFAFFLIVEKMGERELAISNITRNIYMLLMICLMGFSNATNTIVSNLVGQEKRGEIFGVLKKIILLSASSTLVVALLNLVFWRYSVSIFTSNPELIEASFGCISVISGSSLFFSVAYVLLSAVSGSGGTSATLIIEATTLLFYLIATYITAIYLKSKIEIVWCTEYVYFIAMGILSYCYLKYRILRLVKN
jgi:Na+-driven multidrug efflux pump